jgi:hypothetical protein
LPGPRPPFDRFPLVQSQSDFAPQQALMHPPHPSMARRSQGRVVVAPVTHFHSFSLALVRYHHNPSASVPWPNVVALTKSEHRCRIGVNLPRPHYSGNSDTSKAKSHGRKTRSLMNIWWRLSIYLALYTGLSEFLSAYEHSHTTVAHNIAHTPIVIQYTVHSNNGAKCRLHQDPPRTRWPSANNADETRAPSPQLRHQHFKRCCRRCAQNRALWSPLPFSHILTDIN